ncbi:MAG: error-prone polymerase, partial [Acidimicrobiaceae bacterium]
FPRDIREVLIPRVHARYGHDRSALVAAFSTFHSRSAIRDFGKALGIPPGEVERAARSADPWGVDDVDRHLSQAIGRRIESPRWQALMRLVRDSHLLQRHMSQHPGGMVISTQPLDAICPIQPAAMDGRQMVQWDKESCADAGFLKIDLLGLGMLSAVERCVDEIARVRGKTIDLSRIDWDDKEVYREIQEAETMGVFQIESRAQMQMLKRTLPESLDDLTVQVALVRPGPIQGGAVHPYIERRRALRADPSYKVPYEHPSLEPVLRDTLGAIVFQDQVIEVAMAFAGFAPGEAEGLRRAMSRARSEAAMRSYEAKFVEGAIARGASEESARRVYGQIVGFSGFGFPKAHSAAFGLLAYQSTWLRVHYGAEFLCALLNEQPMGFYPPDTLVHEAQRRSIPVLPPCVSSSIAECRVERLRAGPVSGGDSLSSACRITTPSPSGEPLRKVVATVATRPIGAAADGLGVRLGLGYVAGVSSDDVRAIVDERGRGGAFASVESLASRCATRVDALERLAWSGALDSMVADGRREALWRLGVAAPGVRVAGGTQLALPVDVEAPELESLSPWERMLADYGSTRVTLREHPLGLMRPELGDEVLSSADLERTRNGAPVRVAGMVVARQRPATAKGITFMLLEDEHGTINLIVPPRVYERHRLTVRTEPLMLAEGKLERFAAAGGAINVLVDRVDSIDAPDRLLADIKDFSMLDEQVRRGLAEQKAAAGGEAEDFRAVAPPVMSFASGRRR